MGTKLTGLSTITGANIAKNDKLYIGDVSAGTSGSKAITVAEILEAERLWRNPQTLYVNDFYPAEVTDYADGTSHPLSEFFGSLGAAETAFPHIDFTEWGIELTDEVDWVAWMSASQYMFDNRNQVPYSATNDYGSWKLIADGDYRVNKSIIFTCWAVWIAGSAGRPERQAIGSTTSITYAGDEGTDTDKIFVIDHYTQDDPGQRPPPPGAAPTPHPNRLIGGTGAGGALKMTEMLVMGRGNGVHSVTVANSPDTSGVGYVVGVRCRDAAFTDISGCAFGGSLLDAIWISSALWTRIEFNFFYDIYRDCVSIIGFPEDFSTTCWIDDNEFGYYGRYAILQNYLGGVEPAPSVRRNSIEGASTVHYYHTHLEEWVQGVRSSICQIGGTFGNYSENRCEATIYETENMWADLHLVEVNYVTLRDNRWLNVVVGARRDSQYTTTAYDTFLETYNYVDINAARNIYAPEAGDYSDSTQLAGLILDGFVQGYLVNLAGVSASNGALGNSFRSGSMTAINVETYSGTYITQAYAPGEGHVTMGTLGSTAQLLNFLDYSSNYGPIIAGSLNYDTDCGDFAIVDPAAVFGTWTANTVYNDKLRATDTEVAAGAGRSTDKWIVPTVFNGCIYEASATTGTRKSHATTEPTWPTTVGNTVVDNEVTWKCIRSGVPPRDSGYNYCVLQFGKKIVQRNIAPPTTGTWTVGDLCYVRIPDVNNVFAYVCVAQGTPGTWQPIGGSYGYVAVASLPSASSNLAGCRAVVSDSNATLSAGLGNTVAAGGSNKVPVFCDGSAWKIG